MVNIKVKLAKFIHRKAAEMLAPLPFGNTNSGAFITGDKNGVMPDMSYLFAVNGTSGIYRYSAEEDKFLQLPSSGITGTFGSGACGEFRAMSCPGAAQLITATGGTTTTVNTSLTITKSLRGCKIRIVNGPGAGFEGTILRNTIGTNAILTLSGTASAAVTSSSQFHIFAGSLWFFCPGSGTVGFRVYDIATNQWYAKSVTNLPTTFGTDGNLISTGSAQSLAGLGFVNGTSTGSNTSTTIIDTAKTWPVNGWTNSQVRIKSGTGAGQTRTISSNTANTLTVSTAWTTTPDSTSVYVIEGNDDFIYLLGNAAVTLYRYSISTDTWTTLSPATARSGSPGAALMSHFADNVPAWQEENAAVYTTHHNNGLIKQNGRYIYSFRSGGSNTLDAYDLAANTWINTLAYGNQAEGFSTGTSAVDALGSIYIQRESVGRMYRFNIDDNDLEPLFTNVSTQSTSVVGCKTAFQILKASDGSGGETTLPYLYTANNTRPEFFRILLF